MVYSADIMFIFPLIPFLSAAVVLFLVCERLNQLLSIGQRVFKQDTEGIT